MSIADATDKSQDHRLTAEHWHGLTVTRGIAPEIVKERGYLSAPQPEDLRERTFSKAQAKAAPALVIPQWNVHGRSDGWQMRPDQPRQFSSGRVAKYENAEGSHMLLDVHPRVQPMIGNPAVPLWITEGIPKGDALASHGACAIAVTGVWGFRGTNAHGGKVILPDWDHVALNGREVIVVYDSDIYQKRDVERALKALYAFLRSKAAIPRLVQWPEEYRTKKWGVDDFLANNHTLEDVLAMVPPQGQLPGTPPAPERHGITFDLTKGNDVRCALLNVLYVLEQDGAWQGVLGFNELLNDVVLLKRPPYLPAADAWAVRAVRDHDYAEMANWLQRTYRLYASSALAGEGLTTYGFRFPFHPIREYFQRLTWDETPRLETFLPVYCHVEDTPYSRAVGRKTLIAAVARVMEPGCKVDTMTILEGEQGLNKSEGWRALFGEEWFADGLPDVHDKDAAQALNGKWCVELAELSQFQRSEIETVKAFISRRSDRYRPSYGRKTADFPRQQVFVGTTNHEHYFKDRTGNRRYWPVTVEQPCDLTAIERDRDQLWAEAVYRYQQGEPWYMTEAQEVLAREQQALRLEPDDWEESVLTYVEGKVQVTTKAIMVEQFGWENPALWTQANTKRIGAILRGHKWKSAPFREGGKLVKGYVKAPDIGNTSNNPPTSNSASGSKNNAVTDDTGVTGRIYMRENDTQNVDSVDMHKNTTYKASMQNTGNAGNTGNTPLAPAPATDCAHERTTQERIDIDGSVMVRCVTCRRVVDVLTHP